MVFGNNDYMFLKFCKALWRFFFLIFKPPYEVWSLNKFTFWICSKFILGSGSLSLSILLFSSLFSSSSILFTLIQIFVNSLIKLSLLFPFPFFFLILWNFLPKELLKEIVPLLLKYVLLKFKFFNLTILLLSLLIPWLILGKW